MPDIKGEKLYVALSASQTRKRLRGHGFGVRKIHSDGKDRAVIIHTATGDHLRQLEALFQDVITRPRDHHLNSSTNHQDHKAHKGREEPT